MIVLLTPMSALSMLVMPLDVVESTTCIIITADLEIVVVALFLWLS